MRTILNILLLGATCAGVAGCQVPECKLVLACDPPVRETVYLTPTYYSPTDNRIMFAPDHTPAVPVEAPAEAPAAQ
jgi:hypothetical protein